MVIKVFVSTTSCDHEIKRRQQDVVQVLNAKSIPYQTIDVTDDENQEQRDFMREHATSFGETALDAQPEHPLPPQIFNDDAYCGDYLGFEMANESAQLKEFLKLAPEEVEDPQ